MVEGDKHRPKLELDDYFYLTAQMKLPCGCIIYHSTRSPSPPDLSSDSGAKKYFQWHSEVLAHWFRTRIEVEKRHDCSLKTEDNPNGIKPKEA